jgi:hypothetical protein
LSARPNPGIQQNALQLVDLVNTDAQPAVSAFHFVASGVYKPKFKLAITQHHIDALASARFQLSDESGVVRWSQLYCSLTSVSLWVINLSAEISVL